jgi:thioester reductase-like protein
MTKILLTGATGLLGSYLLRDLMRRGEHVTVLVRPTRFETAEQRIDQLFSFWEDEWKRTLPRPTILCGEINEPRLGLDRCQAAWVRRHCDCVMHSAASLTFHAEGDEPYRTNVEGTKNLLSFCRETGIANMAYISTAYVCGRHFGIFRESELEIGQEFSNDYEKSKFQAEQLVRGDRHLEAFTIFRPSIIVGDYRTGYTSTFHGFYVPLRIAYALANMIHYDQLFEVDYLQILGLKGDERKNLVPVDWVSDAIVSIFARQPPKNRTYALVSQNPVTTLRLRTVFGDAIRRLDGVAKETSAAAKADFAGMEAFEQAYVDQFAVYRSYWRDDPQFDCSNTLSVLGGKPCPVISDEVLLKLCRFAVESHFGWPRSFAPKPDFSPRDWMRRNKGYVGWRVEEREPPAANGDRELQLDIAGLGGGQWAIRRGENGDFTCREDRGPGSRKVRMNALTFQELTRGELTLKQAVANAKVIVYGDSGDLAGLVEFLRN